MNLSTAPLAHDINNNAFQNNLMKQNIANNPSPNNLPEQVRFSNRSVSTTPPKKSIWSSIKSVPRKISIFFRAVAKVVVLGYYFVKHVVIKKPVDTPQKLNSILNNLGPAFAKIMQPMIGNIGESSSLVSQGLLRFPDDKKDFTPDETRKIKEMTTAVKGILDNIKTTDMTCEQAQTILNKRFKGKYTVGDCLGAGTIASCYEITSNTDGTKYVAKVMSPKTEDQLAVGIRSLELFSWLIPKSFKSIVQSTLSAFRDECNLSSEHRKLCGFRTAIMAADKLGRFSHKLEKTKYTTLNGHQIPEPDITTIEADLSFSVPEAVEPLDPNNDNLLIMQKADGHTLATLMTNRALFSQEFKKCFARDPETVDQQREDDHDELQSLESAILERVSAKWNQVLATQGWVHGDLHPGNIMISFKPDNKIVVSLIDLGNSLKLEDSELQFVKDLFNSVKSFAATTKTPGDMINPEYPNFRRPIYHVTGNNKEKILDNLYSNDAEQIKSLFDLVMRQASNKKLSDKMKENIYRAMFYRLSHCRFMGTPAKWNIDFSLSHILSEFMACGVKFPQNLYHLLSATMRGQVHLDSDIITTGRLPVRTAPRPAPASVPMPVPVPMPMPMPMPMPVSQPDNQFSWPNMYDSPDHVALSIPENTSAHEDLRHHSPSCLRHLPDELGNNPLINDPNNNRWPPAPWISHSPQEV